MLFIDRSSPTSPEDSERAQIILYDVVDSSKKEPGVVETADNPQYGEVQTDLIQHADDPKTNEKIYSYRLSQSLRYICNIS